MKTPLFCLAASLAVSLTFAGSYDTKITALGSNDYTLRTQAREDLQLAFSQVDGVELDAMQRAVIARLEGDLLLEERLYLLRLLEWFGTKEAVEPIALLLNDADPKVRDSAIRALSGITGDEASYALAKAFHQASGADKLQIMDALAYRSDKRTVAIIAKALSSPDSELSKMAAIALGKIGSTEAIPALMEALPSAAEPLDVELAILRIGADARTAQTLAESGSQVSVRVEAFCQLHALNAKAAEKVLNDLLALQSAPARSQILNMVWKMAAPDLQRRLVQLLPEASVTDKILIVSGIASTGENDYESDLLALFPLEDDELLKQVMMQALGTIGGDDSFAPVYAAFQANSKDIHIGNALARLKAPLADKTALGNAGTAVDVDERISAIKVLELRNPEGCTDLLNKIAAAGGEAEVRKAAFSALESVGNLESLEIFIRLIIEQDPLMRNAQRSLKRLCLNFRATDYLWNTYFQPALNQAATDEQRLGLILILDGVDSEGSLNYLKDLVLSSNGSELRNAALKTLSRWSSYGNARIWMEIQQSDAAYRQDAIKAIHRSVSSDSVDGSVNDKVETLIELVQSASDPSLKRDLLSVYLDPPSRYIWVIKAKLKVLTDDPDVGEMAKGILSQFK